MNKIIGVTELQRNFRTVFDQVVNEHTPYILTRGSRPEAAIIPYDQYLKYVQAHDKEVHARFDALLERMAKVNAKFSDKEVERDVEEVSRAVKARRRLRDKRQNYRVAKPNAPRSPKAKK
ncbi:MAG: type II toxin-antitoxin system Phd/YefM family antitoxin [Chloroflexi bacterium]|nr:type II toxin-antitoxin system Phd/YefM family antitoxin [Chloroflexota bacterium]